MRTKVTAKQLQRMLKLDQEPDAQFMALLDSLSEEEIETGIIKPRGLKLKLQIPAQVFNLPARLEDAIRLSKS